MDTNFKDCKFYKQGDLFKQIVPGATIYVTEVIHDEMVVTPYEIDTVNQSNFEAVKADGTRRLFYNTSLGSDFFFNEGLANYYKAFRNNIMFVGEPITALALKNFQKGNLGTGKTTKRQAAILPVHTMWSAGGDCFVTPIKEVNWKEAEIDKHITAGGEVYVLDYKDMCVVNKCTIISVLNDSFVVETIMGERRLFRKSGFLNTFFTHEGLAKFAANYFNNNKNL